MKYIFCFLILLVICFVSLVVTYGYEEGTMRCALIGDFFKNILLFFKFPLAYLLPIKFFILALFLDVVIHSILIMGFLKLIALINKS